MTITLTRLAGDGFHIGIGPQYGLVINPASPDTLAAEAPAAPCQYILLTHWEESLWQAAIAIARAHKSIILTAKPMAEHLETLYKSGIADVSIMALSTEAQAELPWGVVSMVACAHEYLFPHDPAPYQANGYVLFAEGHALYYAGPTVMSPVLRDVGKLYKPDVSIFNIGEQFLNGQELCQAVMWLGSDIVLPLAENTDAQAEAYNLIDMYTPAICRFLNPGDTYILPPVEATGRISGPEARY